MYLFLPSTGKMGCETVAMTAVAGCAIAVSLYFIYKRCQRDREHIHELRRVSVAAVPEAVLVHEARAVPLE